MNKKLLFTVLILVAFQSFSSAAVRKDEHLPRAKVQERMTSAAEEFTEATKTAGENAGWGSIEIHSLMILQHGKVVYENWYNGASAGVPHVLYSVSKTFTASATGLVISEGKLALSDKVLDFFPENRPAEVPARLEDLTMRNLLTMNSGHDCEPLSLWDDNSNVNWIDKYLEQAIEYVPGTRFMYNSYDSYMLSTIVQKATGEKVVDYLNRRLFLPLGIEKPRWDEDPQGNNCGGWGLYLKTEDLAKFGQLLLQGGKWNGRQVLPEWWVKEMTSFQVASAPAGTPFEDIEKLGLTKANSDWVQGYGYQMWMCRHNAYRADGAQGQFIIVLPDQDAVVVLTSYSDLYQEYIDLVWKYLPPVLD